MKILLLYSFECPLKAYNKIKKFGENSYGDTPGHISNPEVKPVNAESTWGAAPWEDRNLPNFFFYYKIMKIYLNIFYNTQIRRMKNSELH